jgi:hypothetical protein
MSVKQQEQAQLQAELGEAEAGAKARQDELKQLEVRARAVRG